MSFFGQRYVITSTDAKGKISSVIYDDKNRVTSSTDRLAYTTSFEYDLNNNRIAIWDAKQLASVGVDYSKATRYKYDERNLLVTVAYPGHPSSAAAENSFINLALGSADADYDRTSCEYDGLRRKEKCTDQQSDSVEYTFNMLNQLKERNYFKDGTAATAESTDEFTYDGSSRLLTASKGRYGINVSCLYDLIGRKFSETQTVNGVNYTNTNITFDDDSRLTNKTLSSARVVAKTYTDRHQLQTISLDNALMASFAYDDGMREKTRTYASNGLITTRNYRGEGSAVQDNLLASISVNGKTDLSFAYNHDANKNVIDETSLGTVMSDYSWDTTKNSTIDGFDALRQHRP